MEILLDSLMVLVRIITNFCNQNSRIPRKFGRGKPKKFSKFHYLPNSKDSYIAICSIIFYKALNDQNLICKHTVLGFVQTVTFMKENIYLYETYYITVDQFIIL